MARSWRSIQTRYPRCYLHRSHPSDVARTEHLTFICSKRKEDAGPTNHWMSPEDAQAKVWPLLEGSMRGRDDVRRAVPHGAPGIALQPRRESSSPTARTWSPTSALMTRAGDIALAELGESSKFVRGIHSLGDLEPRATIRLPLPRIADHLGRRNWIRRQRDALQEVATGSGSRAPRVAIKAGWPSTCWCSGSPIRAATRPSSPPPFRASAARPTSPCSSRRLPGYQIETVGDDICWMHVGSDGRLWAINPEYGMFGAARSTSEKTNPNAMRALRSDAIFTNVALRPDQSPWWEGMGEEPVDGMLDWKGQVWHKGSHEPASHPNARFTIALKACASASPSVDDPAGVPISAIIFGGRRVGLSPLVMQATSWEHGVYMGATLVSETTAAATGTTGIPRHDPMAMLPFCGYNMADYFAHWLSMGKKARVRPRFFTSIGFAVAPTGNTCGQASARTCACSNGSPSAFAARPTPSKRSSGMSPPRRASILRGSTCPRATSKSFSRSTRARGKTEPRASALFWARSVRSSPTLCGASTKISPRASATRRDSSADGRL